MTSSPNKQTNGALFVSQLESWQQSNGRHDLPWQQRPTPYSVWVSEIMLQQTQVEKVKQYFNKFIDIFPTVTDLSQADISSVLELWAGLGYYRRAHNMHKAAQLMVERHHAEVPQTLAELKALPGVGRSTAGAILSLSMNEQAAILDANAKRVVSRYSDMIEAKDTQLWKVADNLATYASQPAVYTQGLMDLGSRICTVASPLCHQCPVSQICQSQNKVAKPTLAKTKPKPKKQISLKWLLVTCESEILLTRSDQNIWQGLWLLPEPEALAEVVQIDLENPAVPVQRLQWHLTHIKYDIEVVLVNLNSQQALQAENQQASWCWSDASDIIDTGKVAVPSVVKKIVKSHLDDGLNRLDGLGQ